MRKIKRSIDLIEEADKYVFLSKNVLDIPVNVGNREKLAQILKFVPPEMVIATFVPDKKKCLILMDYELGELMDLVTFNKVVEI